jgi:hypothetical protein
MEQYEPKERGFKQGFKRTARSKALKNQDREKEAMRVVSLQPSVQHT